jgi:hypothetical protein
MKHTFDGDVAVLVQAYMNNTLQSANCSACAVGNLLAHANGLKYERVNDVDILGIANLDLRIAGGCHLDFIKWYKHRSESGMRVKNTPYIEASGYSIEDLDSIEHAFETATHEGVPTSLDYDELVARVNTDEAIFRGLMAVVDVLADIYNVDLEVTEKAKAMFVK